MPHAETMRRVYVQRNMSDRVDEHFLRWLGYILRLRKERGRPSFSCLEGIKIACSVRLLKIDDGTRYNA